MQTQTVKDPRWMPREVFDEIYGRVPRLSVDLLVRTKDGFVLTKRDIEPCAGQWHMPGGTVFFGEKLVDAVRRIAASEIGVEVTVGKQIGHVEYSSLCEGPQKTWTVALVFEVTVVRGELGGSEQGREVGIFKQIPENTIKDQAGFLATIL